MVKNLNNLGRNIIEGNQYVTLSTSSIDGVPWVSPVVYTFDKDWNLYFISMPTSRHCTNISENKQIAAAIFDSHQLWGEGVGLQIEGTCEQVKITELPKAIRLYATRKYPYGGVNTKRAMEFAKAMVIKGKKYMVYKIISEFVWMNDPNSRLDVRVKIDLNI